MYDDIHLFIQLINCGGFSHVANKLKIHQTTISKRIVKLEQQLNVVLINRNTRCLQLTSDGQYIYDSFKTQFDLLDEVIDEVLKPDLTKIEGKLSIAMSPSLGTVEVNRLILEFAQMYPRVLLDIHYVITDVNLLRDNYDLAITLSKPAQELAVIKTVWQLNTILCASPEYVKNFGKPELLEDLEQHKIILPLISMRNNSILEGIHCAENRLVSQVFNRHCVAVNSSTNNVSFALTGKCIVPLYDCIARKYLESGQLIRILPEYQALPVNVYLTRPTSYKNRLVDLFTSHVSEYLGKLSQE